jgi:hypothetical protein
VPDDGFRITCNDNTDRELRVCAMNKNEVCAGLTRTKTRFVPVEKRGFCRLVWAEEKNEIRLDLLVFYLGSSMQWNP